MKITYEDKVTYEEHPEIPEINKCTADNLNQIKNAINTNDDTLNTAVSNMTITKVWENSAPTSVFGPQAISIPDLDEATFVIITYYAYKDLLQLYSLVLNVTDGLKGVLNTTFVYQSAFFSGFRTVDINVSQKNIVFEDGLGFQQSTGAILRTNDWTVPYQIYLIKLPKEDSTS